MTTELEKQFFETFGIEPIKVKICRNINHCPKKYKLCNDDCKHWQTLKTEYPQITDRHYLELILIYSRISNLPICYDTVERFKEAILEDFIENSEDYKHQVQELFKGE